MAANLLADDKEPQKDFDWLDDLPSDDCFVDHETSLPNRSLDFGRDGYTGSATAWNELLQITAPDSKCGIVYIRGDFPDNADSFLARAQRHDDQRGTWGLKPDIDSNGTYTLEGPVCSGMINLRWPYAQFKLVRQGYEDGLYSTCSFVKDKAVYQIVRIIPGKKSTANERQGTTTRDIPKLSSDETLNFNLGGTIRFGCACSNATCSSPFERQYRFKDNYLYYPSQDGTALLCRSQRHEKTLRMRVWVDRTPIDLRESSSPFQQSLKHDEYREWSVDVTSVHHIKLVDETPVTVVASFSLIEHCGSSTDDPEHEDIDPSQAQRSDAEPHVDRLPPKAISSSIAQNYLGVADISLEAAYRLWNKALTLPGSSTGSFEASVIGRNVEQILCVTCTPVTIAVAHQSRSFTLMPTTDVTTMSTLTEATLEALDTLAKGNSEDTAPEKESRNKDLEGNRGVDDSNSDDAEVGSRPITLRAMAMVRNLIGPQWVDLESTFWQLRLLVRAYAYFGPLSPMPELPVADDIYGQPIAEMGKLYRTKLLEHIRAACVWLLHARLEYHPGLLSSDIAGASGRRDCFQYLFPLFADNDRIWYILITIWYVLHHCPDACANHSLSELLWIYLDDLGNIDQWVPDQDDNRPRSCFLQWYSYYSFTEICKYLEKEDSERFRAHRIDLAKTRDQVRTWRAKAEKKIKPSGNSRSAQVLVTDHHIIELVFLGEEIIASTDSKSTKCLPFARDALRNREATKLMNPGTVEKYQSINSSQNTSPPWEFFCLNHHIMMRPEAEAVDSDMELAFSDCREFLFSDYTFMKSWDRSNVDMVGEWWDVMTGSMVVTTLLDNLFRDQPINPQLLATSGADTESAGQVSSEAGDNEGPGDEGGPVRQQAASEPLDSGSDKAVKPIDGERSVAGPRGTITPGQTGESIAQEILGNLNKGLERLIKGAAERSVDDDDDDGFDWMRLKPQRPYFPDTVTQSLEDTPTLFEARQTKNVNIRSNIKKYLARKNANTPPDLTLHNFRHWIQPEELLYLSCFDLALSLGQFGPEVFISSAVGRANPNIDTISIEYNLGDQLIPYELKNERPSSSEESNEKGLKEEDRKPSLWVLYLQGRPELHSTFKSLPRAVKEKLRDMKLRNDILSEYHRSLSCILHDSMVDLGTRYRIFFAQRICPKIIQAFMYMWHTDALDTFDDHLGPVSRFYDSDASSSSGDVWITSITISHWGLEYVNEGFDDIFDEERGEKAGFPPQAVSGRRHIFPRLLSLGKPEHSPNTTEIGEASSSIVITGDENGASWTCSIISPLLDEFHMRSCVEDARRIAQMFIHQQSDGRALVFILFLGHLCESLAREYEYFLDSLDNIMGMGQRVLLRGMEWEKSEVALRKLKKMLWCLEALRIFDDKLTSALAEIKEARKQIQQELTKSYPLRSRTLGRYCEKIGEEFDKRYNRLEDAHSTILQRIEQSTNLREGITSVLGVEQNENIGMLTYITIAYLPLSFIAALFSMTVTPSEWGGITFGWLTVVFFVGTFAFALSLQTILGTIRKAIKLVDGQLIRLEKKAAKKAHKARPPTPPGGPPGGAPKNEHPDGQKTKTRATNSSGLNVDLEQGNSNGSAVKERRSTERVSVHSKAASVP